MQVISQDYSKMAQKSIIEPKKPLINGIEREACKNKQGEQKFLKPSSIPDKELDELKKTTIPLMAAVAISNIMFTSLHSFFPLYIEIHFPTLTAIHFSTIIAIFEIANLATSLILGLNMNKMRRKALIVWSNILMLLSTLAFAALPYLTE